MWIGWIECDLLLGDTHSLKEKRSLVRPLINQVRRNFEVSVAEVEYQDLHRRAAVGIGLVASDRARIVEQLDAVEDYVARRPEFELLGTRRKIITSDD
jgi:uncharacterized protein